MKKTILLFALCLIGACYLSAQTVPGTPIVFVNVYAVMPLDDPYNGDGTGGPDPTQEIIGGIDGNDLNIGIVDPGNADAGDVIVIDPETGEIITEGTIVGQTSIHIPEPGSYTAYVVVGGTTYAGDFVVE